MENLMSFYLIWWIPLKCISAHPPVQSRSGTSRAFSVGSRRPAGLPATSTLRFPPRAPCWSFCERTRAAPAFSHLASAALRVGFGVHRVSPSAAVTLYCWTGVHCVDRACLSDYDEWAFESFPDGTICIKCHQHSSSSLCVNTCFHLGGRELIVI